MMKKYIIEEIENSLARCEDEEGNFTDIKLSLLPENVKAGYVIGFEDGKYFYLREETENRKNRIMEIRKKLLNKKRNQGNSDE